jgi:3-deoxy-D-manno-octulosonic acid kinase
VADEGRLGALRAAGLFEPVAVENLLADAAGARGRGPIAVVPLECESLALRGLRRGGLLGPWLGGAIFDPSRPARELCATARLRAAGAPVATPVLALAWRRGWLWRGAVATRFVPDAIDAGAFLEAAPSPERCRRILAAAGRTVRRFHDAGGWHADLHVANLLVRETQGPEIWIIDLDRARVGPPPDPRARMSQLMRLYRSLRKRGLLAAAGGARGCATFLSGYADGDRALRRALAASLPAERRRVALHALRYRRS